MEWWMTQADRDPVGPVSTELLLQGIEDGTVPKDALVCEVGGTRWKGVGEVPEFLAALDEHQRHQFDPDNEKTPLDLVAQDEFSRRAGRSPLRPSDVRPREWLERFDDAEETTSVDERPIRLSEPPTEP